MHMPSRSLAPAVEAGRSPRNVALTRRRFLSGLAGLGASIPLASLLAACGDDDEDPTATPSSNPTGTGQAPTATSASPGEDAVFPVTIEHKYGATTIDRVPERVAVVGLTEQDALLALGVVPVCTREWYGERPGAIFPWAAKLLGDTESPVVLDFELDFERIAALNPDVIIGLYSALTTEEYDTLARIAPTVAQPAEYVDWGVPWQDATLKVGKILGKEHEAEDLIAGIEADFAAVREAHPEFEGATALVASPYGLPENFWIYGSQDPRGRFMTSLGFEIPAVFDEFAGEEFGGYVSVEQFNLIADLDVMIWVADEDYFEDIPLYQSLPVVREGRVLYFGEDDPVYDALNFSTVLSLPFALEQVVPQFAAAIDGDPETQASE